MKELLFLLFLYSCARILHFLRSGLIVHSGVNIAWLLVCSGSSQTLSCWHTKPQCALSLRPVNTSPPHPSSLDFLSSLDPSLPSPFSIFPLPPHSALLTQAPEPSCPGAFLHLYTSPSSSPVIRLPLSSSPADYTTYINRGKEARKVVGSTGWSTLMRSLWFATQPKNSLPPSHLHPLSFWFPLD